MKRDLIYLALIVAAITAVKVTARTTPETPAEIRPLRIEAGFKVKRQLSVWTSMYLWTKMVKLLMILVSVVLFLH